MKNEIIKQALKYCEMGFSVIPVGADKKPLISWQEFQNKKVKKEVAVGFSYSNNKSLKYKFQ